YVTGDTASHDFPTKNAFQNELPVAVIDERGVVTGGFHVFVTKFDYDGDALVYSTYLGGGGVNGEFARGIAVDAHRNAYVSGFTDSTDFPTKHAFQNKLRGSFGTTDA